MIGVVADDLTGAAELGAVGLRHGLSSEVLMEGRPSGNAELVCVDTDSRGCSPTEAGRRVSFAAKQLTSSGAKWIYKKVDSVLRGQVVAELEAAMKALSLSRTLLVPVNPSLGRVIRQGRYFVQDAPVNETDFRFDPEYPRLSSDVRKLLGDSAAIYVRRADETLPAAGIVVGEAATADDLRRWANRSDEATLSAGGSEFFAALLAQQDRTPTAPNAGLMPGNCAAKELFVCGSTSESCCEFVSCSRKQGVPVFRLPQEVALGHGMTASVRQQLAEQILAALHSSQRVIISIGLPLVANPSIARQLADHLIDLAETVLSQTTGIHILAEGGATAVRLIRRLGWTRLTVAREIALGVVTLRTSDGPHEFLTLKPGSYRWPDTFWGQVRTEEAQS